METQELLRQLSLNEPTDINTKILLHILKNMIELTGKMDAAVENGNLLKGKIAELEKRVLDLESKQKELANCMPKQLNGEFDNIPEKIDFIQNETDFLHQWRIDNDLFLSGFPSKPDINEVTGKLTEIYQFSPLEITYKYSFTYTNPRTKNKNHYAVVGLNRRDIKDKIFTAKKIRGPLFLSDLFDQSAAAADPEIQISNRLTVPNLRLQRVLTRLKKNSLLHKILYKNCSLYIVPAPNSSPVSIKCFEDIENYKKALLNPNPNQILSSTSLKQPNTTKTSRQSSITSYLNIP